jgi:hypothetical protein
MKERPILFSGGMVRAILDGSKTQTRRVVKHSGGMEFDPQDPHYRCPHGTPGDRLWVRETWAHERDGTGCPDDTGVLYRATDPGWDDEETGLRWRPSIFMPRIASRILLEITDVRVQRLQEISADDCRAEGHPADWSRSPDPEVHNDAARDWYMDLWQSINGSDSWHANPWVWAITFRRLQS